MSDAPRRLLHYFTHSNRKGRAGLPLMSVTMHDGLVRRDTLDRKTDSALTDEEHLLIEPGDIAYNMMRMWQGALGLADEAANVSPAYGVMRPKDTVDPRFAKHWFKSDRGLYLLWAYSYGLTNDRLRLYPAEFLRIPVNWPSLPEQSTQADILDIWDAAVTAAEGAAKLKRRALSKRFSDLLSGTEDFSPLSKLASINSKSLKDTTDPDKIIEYYPIGEDEGGGRIRFEDAPSRARRLARGGDVIYSTVRPLLRRLFVAKDIPDAVYSTGYAILHPKRPKDTEFIFHLLTSEIFERQVYARQTGSGYPAISAQDLRTVKLPDLPPARRDHISDSLRDAFIELDLARKRSLLLRRQRSAMRQRLLSEAPRHSES